MQSSRDPKTSLYPMRSNRFYLEPWSSVKPEQKYQAEMDYQIKKECKHVYLADLRSPEIGKGMGTAKMRELVKVSLENDCDGNVEVLACYSSHLFYLYMGMIPKQIDTPVELKKDEQAIFDALLACHSEEDLYALPKNILDSLKAIIADENINSVSDVMTTIWQNRENLLSLRKHSNSLQDDFIPNLLDILEKNVGNKFPDTSDLWGVSMCLSNEGKARWLEAISQDKPFVPFRDLEPLKCLMTAKQIEVLDGILAQNSYSQLPKELCFESGLKLSSGPVFRW